jgi:putative transcriptional regulator
MSIQHHPADAFLTAFAAGTLDQGQHVAVATHLASCSRCRTFVRSMEQVGGAVLTRLAPTAMASDALARAAVRLRQPAPEIKHGGAAAVSPSEVPGLPEFVRRYRFGRWKWIAPSVHLSSVELPYGGDTRVFLLKSGPKTRMLQHSHTGIEMTCVLSGAFSHEGGRYGPGDFDLGDETVHHQPVVDVGEDCICLVAMTGQLRLNGLIGRLVQPFVRL